MVIASVTYRASNESAVMEYGKRNKEFLRIEVGRSTSSFYDFLFVFDCKVFPCGDSLLFDVCVICLLLFTAEDDCVQLLLVVVVLVLLVFTM